MRKLIKDSLIGMISLLLIGCGAAANEIRVKAQTERTDVFFEVNAAGVASRGVAVLTIKATIKTPLAGYYPFGAMDSLDGKPGYPFLINIDGQAETWMVEGQKETLPLYDNDGKTSRDPDAGEGIKYVLEKKVALRAGTHRVFLGLTADNYFKEVEITLKDGDSATLEFKPVYQYKTRPARIPAFARGIKAMEIYLNGIKSRDST